jgi:hypothetical protein
LTADGIARVWAVPTDVCISAPSIELANDLSVRNPLLDSPGYVLVSATATDVNTKFTSSTIPVVTWNQDLYDDLGMVTSNSAYYGTIASQTQLTVVDANLPLAAGLNRIITVVSNASTFAFARPLLAYATLRRHGKRRRGLRHKSGQVWVRPLMSGNPEKPRKSRSSCSYVRMSEVRWLAAQQVGQV